MKRIVIVGVVAAVFALAFVPGGAVAADRSGQNVTQGEFAQLLLQMMAKKGQPALSPSRALARVQGMKLVPATWKPNAVMTHDDLEAMATLIGANYVSPVENIPVSRDVAVAVLEMYQDRVEAVRGGDVATGLSTSMALDPGSDRAISPSNFDRR